MQMNQWTLNNDSISQNSVTEEISISHIGMAGEPIPYKLYSDGNIIAALAIGFLLIVIALQNENKSIWKLFKNCIVTPGRSNLFDNSNNQSYIFPTLLLCITTTLMCGLLTYHYQSYSSPDFFNTANHMLMLATYVSLFLLLILAKWILYTIIDWIFFDKEKKRLWHKAFFNIISSIGLVLFVAAIYIIFLDSEFHISSIIILIIIVLSKILLFYNCIKYFFNSFYGSLHLILYFCTLEIIPDLVLWKSLGFVNSILI